MSPVRPQFVQQAPEAVSRRRLVTGAVAAGVGAAFAGSGATAQDATPTASTEISTIETVSGQALYTLPRDHRWHGGPFYETGEYWEWYYWKFPELA